MGWWSAYLARRLEKRVEARTRELSALSTHLQQLAEKEKSELARNLHDELGGLLTAAKMDLSWLQGRITGDAAIEQRLHQLGAVLDEAMDVKRRVVEELRPSLLDHFGLATALGSYVESVCRQSGLQADVAITADEDFPRDIAIGLFRIVQEGMTNVVRHAHARGVRLELSSGRQIYRLNLVDDGCGIDLADPAFRWSHGLTGMRHRVSALGGRFSLVSARGAGTALRVELPRRPA
jgi:signal transduction histidine kinase